MAGAPWCQPQIAAAEGPANSCIYRVLLIQLLIAGARRATGFLAIFYWLSVALRLWDGAPYVAETEGEIVRESLLDDI
jgi:hypothetical protein